MPGQHGVHVALQKIPHLFRLRRVYDQHNSLLKEQIVDLVRLLFQRQKSVLSRKLRHLHQCVDQFADIVLLPLKQDLRMLKQS